jgi:hypothetical protein
VPSGLYVLVRPRYRAGDGVVSLAPVADWETVRELARAFPEAEEDTTHSQPAFRVRGKLFVWMSPHEKGALCVRIDPAEKPFLLESDPETYYTTPHYEGYPAVLIRLAHVEREQLAERIEDAWLLRAPKRVVDRFVTDS